MYDFVAIDFETATNQMSSACAIGIVAVKDLKTTEHFYSLIKPPQNKYDFHNIEIHHITPDMTENAPTLTELWPQIEKFFDEHVPVVAHNAHFDMSVLRLSTEIEIPDFVYVDSMKIASHFTGNMKLVDVAEDFNVDVSSLIHHNAEDDAWMCAEITVKAIYSLGCASLWEYLARYPYDNRNSFSELRPRKTFRKIRYESFEHVKPSSIKRMAEPVNTQCPLYGKNIVFTGTLSIDRAEAMQIAVNAGAQVKTSVSKKTHYLVVGKQDLDLVGVDGMSSKEEKAYELNESGQASIEILSERDFLYLANKETADGSTVNV